MLCRHCGKGRATRPRGLCWTCYYKPAIREKYPSTSRFARRGLGTGNGPVGRPPMPTRALPGTPEKIEVLTERARRRQELWHKDDATLTDGIADGPSARGGGGRQPQAPGRGGAGPAAPPPPGAPGPTGTKKT
ncbi:MAG: hypothetical protein NZ700_16400, partial [Gemmataceae bacterium]|nr:hypothetical protein [Gemmataceae bacterium]MDW8265221.1 hypothetical protein [Gemmataceae bacterium]